MSRVQLALRVADLEGSIAFYSKPFGVEPAKCRPCYANFAIAEPPLKLVLIEGEAGEATRSWGSVFTCRRQQPGRNRLVMAPRMPITGQPPLVGHLHPAHGSPHRITPPQQPTRLLCSSERLTVPHADPLQRPRVQHQCPATGHAKEKVGRMPTPPTLRRPQQPNGCDARGHRRIEVDGDQVIALNP